MLRGLKAGTIVLSMLGAMTSWAAPAAKAKPETGKLTVTIVPKGVAAKLELTDPAEHKLQAGLPYENKKALAGQWKVTARATGYSDESDEVEVTSDQAASVTLELKKAGGLKLTATPEGSTFLVTGPNAFRKEGTLPFDGAGLRAGSYRALLTHAGHQTVERDITVEPGATASINVTLLAGVHTSGRATGTSPSEARGFLSSSQVQDVAQSHNGEYQYCYEKELSKFPDLAGTVMVHIQVDPVGYVSNAEVKETDLHNEGVESCLLSNVKRWKFPMPRGGQLADVNYPFSFNSK